MESFVSLMKKLLFVYRIVSYGQRPAFWVVEWWKIMVPSATSWKPRSDKIYILSIPSTSRNFYWVCEHIFQKEPREFGLWLLGLLLSDEDQLLQRSSVAMIQCWSGSIALPSPIKNSNLWWLLAIVAQQRITLPSFSGFFQATAAETKAFWITSPDSSCKSSKLNLVGFNSMKF